MIECVRKYTPEQLKPHLADLWDLLKKEILGIKLNVNEDVINTCHKVIHEVTFSLANAIQTIENRQVIITAETFLVPMQIQVVSLHSALEWI